MIGGLAKAMVNLYKGEVLIKEEDGQIVCTIRFLLDDKLLIKEDKAPVTIKLVDQQFMVLADKVLEDNLANTDFDTRIWSSVLGIGRTRLFSKIKQFTGMTPNDYIMYVKMNKSVVMLADPGLTITEIAALLGFSSPAYFSRCFKKQYGVNPASYRKNL